MIRECQALFILYSLPATAIVFGAGYTGEPRLYDTPLVRREYCGRQFLRVYILYIQRGNPIYKGLQNPPPKSLAFAGSVYIRDALSRRSSSLGWRPNRIRWLPQYQWAQDRRATRVSYYSQNITASSSSFYSPQSSHRKRESICFFSLLSASLSRRR